MANMNLLVPGTGGITLMNNLGEDLGYPVKMQLGVLSDGLLGLSAGELIDLLSMDHRPGQLAPAKTSLKPGISIRPGHVLQVAYNQVPSSFNHFLYDWRADIRYSAGQLLDFLRERRHIDGRWNLVGHSQGGLLIILASKLLAERAAFAELVASVVLVGTPLAGTINAAHALIEGDQMGAGATAALQTIMRTWPALYQMMPAWPAVVNGTGQAAPPDQQLLTPPAWEGFPGISEDLLLRARDGQRLLRDPLGWMEGDIDVRILMARNRPTDVTLQRLNDRLTSAAGIQQLGDTLVPHDQTLSWVGDFVRQFALTFESPCNEHSMLLNDPAILGHVTEALRP
jgi:pimeloyl-ACP methyl ester carboxylesterase